MITDLKELRIRLETHFDIICEENEEPISLGTTILSAIDLCKMMENVNLKTVEQLLSAWQNRDDYGETKPKVVTIK